MINTQLISSPGNWALVFVCVILAFMIMSWTIKLHRHNKGDNQ